MADRNNESLISTQCNVEQEVQIDDDNDNDNDVLDAIASIESNRNAQKKRKQFTSIVSIEDNEFVDVATNSYRIVQNAFKRQKIEIVRLDDMHASTDKLRLQIDELKAALATEQQKFVRILK